MRKKIQFMHNSFLFSKSKLKKSQKSMPWSLLIKSILIIQKWSKAVWWWVWFFCFVVLFFGFISHFFIPKLSYYSTPFFQPSCWNLDLKFEAMDVFFIDLIKIQQQWMQHIVNNITENSTQYSHILTFEWSTTIGKTS